MSTPKILLDVFPANVIVAPETSTLDADTLDPVPDVPETLYREVTRIVVTQDRIIVAQDTPTGAQIIGNELYNQETFRQGTKPDFRTYVETASGKKIAFYKDNGCGCASRLRSWNPYNVIMSSKG
jgi:hypothetical protein